jgi:preprotein translocase subunit SecB
MAESDEQPSSADDNGVVLHPQKIYVKDVSFETPNSPEIFKKQWEPSLVIDMGQEVTELGEHFYEVVLSLTATVKCGDMVAYLAEVQQAGIFVIKGVERENLLHIINVFCPRTLYPYACSAATELVARGGFPQLLFAPVSFEAIYQQRQMESAKAESMQ